MCDHGRLNFHYLHDEKRLTVPQVRDPQGRQVAVEWKRAIADAAGQLQEIKARGGSIAILASARMTNEELYLVRRLASALGSPLVDILARPQHGDDILVSDDGNPNTRGVEILGLTGPNPGSHAPVIGNGINAGKFEAVLCLGEDAADAGATPEGLGRLPCLITLGILPGPSTENATVVLPGSGFAEKRGTMVNLKGRLQRMNKAVNPPGQARDDWEILRDLIQALTGSNGIYSVDDLFRAMANDTPVLSGLTMSRIGDLGVQLELPEGTDAPDVPRAGIETLTADTPSRG